MADQTNIHLFSRAVDSRHKRHLMRALVEIILIDADLVDPKEDGL